MTEVSGSAKVRGMRLSRLELALAFACIVMAIAAIAVNTIGLANYLSS